MRRWLVEVLDVNGKVVQTDRYRLKPSANREARRLAALGKTSPARMMALRMGHLDVPPQWTTRVRRDRG